MPMLGRDAGTMSDSVGVDPSVLEAARLAAAAGKPYVDAPDRAVARVVNRWVETKAHFVDRYADMFANGTKKWPRRAYVELFAGPGVSYNKARGTFVEGSAIRALRLPFTDYVFIDIDARATAALNGRVSQLRAVGALGNKHVKVLTGDCNTEALKIPGLLGRSLSLVFVDPTNWQVSLDTIRLLGARPADLLVTFHTTSMKRMRSVRNAAALDAFFGTPDWRPCLDEPVGQVAEALARLYNRQLEPLGYLPNSYADRIPVTKTNGQEIYELVLFTKNKLGNYFWREALKVTESGQRSFGHWTGW